MNRLGGLLANTVYGLAAGAGGSATHPRIEGADNVEQGRLAGGVQFLKLRQGKSHDRGEVWQLWTYLRSNHRILIIQFRHSETDWTRGLPEFVDLEKNEPLGFVNIAGRLLCKVK